MKAPLQLLFKAAIIICSLAAIFGCGKENQNKENVLKVGIIASLTGPGRSWGEATVNSAQVIADYHNERGGIQIGAVKIPIELVILDDGLEPDRAVEAAHHMAEEELHYVIGPLGDDAIVAAAPILDAAGIFFVHYGFQPDLIRQESLGLLGMPMPVQTLPVLFEHLASNQSVESVMIIARNVEEAIFQKTTAGRLAEQVGLEVLRLSQFDISEETLAPFTNREQLIDRAATITSLNPDVLVLTGFPPSEFTSIVTQMRESGYEGIIATQSGQDPDMLRKIGGKDGCIYFVGGTLPLKERSEYYLDLRRRYLELSGDWSDEADTKFYALEIILQSIQQAGLPALRQTSMFYELFDTASYQDPFYKDERTLQLMGADEFGANRQVSIPTLISKFSEGDTQIAVVATLGESAVR